MFPISFGTVSRGCSIILFRESETAGGLMSSPSHQLANSPTRQHHSNVDKRPQRYPAFACHFSTHWPFWETNNFCASQSEPVCSPPMPNRAAFFGERQRYTSFPRLVQPAFSALTNTPTPSLSTPPSLTYFPTRSAFSSSLFSAHWHVCSPLLVIPLPSCPLSVRCFFSSPPPDSLHLRSYSKCPAHTPHLAHFSPTMRG